MNHPFVKAYKHINAKLGDGEIISLVNVTLQISEECRSHRTALVSEEAGAPTENPHRHGEGMQTPQRGCSHQWVQPYNPLAVRLQCYLLHHFATNIIVEAL